MARIVDGPEITGQVVHKQTGQAYGPVTVTVSPKVYTDREMTASVTSLTTDGQGVFSCYAPPGVYTFTTTAADSGPLEPVEVLGKEGGTGGLGGNAASGSGLPSTIVSRTTAYTATVGDFVECDTTTGGFTVTLPSNPAVGALVAVKRISADSNTLTIAPSGSGTIDGDPTATTSTKMAGAVFEHKGSDVWRITAAMQVTGPQGPTGQAATVAVGTVTTGAAGSSAAVSNAGTTTAAVLNFTIPKGDTGPTGPAGGVLLGEAVSTKLATGGYWYTTPLQAANSTQSAAAGYMWFTYLDQQGVAIDRMAINVSGTSAGAARLGIYGTAANGMPGSLLHDVGVDVGTIDTSTTGFKSQTVSYTLPAGRVWLAVAFNSGAPTVTSFNASSAMPGAPLNVVAGASQPDRVTAPGGTYRINGGITGALPATAYSTVNFAADLQAVCVFVRVV